MYYKGGESQAKKVNLSYTLHPSLRFSGQVLILNKTSKMFYFFFNRRASRIVHKGFEDYACNKQNFLGDEAKVAKLLSLMPIEYK